MSLVMRQRRLARIRPEGGPDLPEPRTRREFRPWLRRRNKHRTRDYQISEGEALAVLSSVAQGRSGAREKSFARDFLGGLGLIRRYGPADEITSAGTALLADCGEVRS